MIDQDNACDIEGSDMWSDMWSDTRQPTTEIE